MKNLIKITVSLFFLFNTYYIQAQNTCEFDSIYIGQWRNEVGYNAVKGNHEKIYIASITGSYYDGFARGNLNLILTTLDNCGNKLWRKEIDTTGKNMGQYAYTKENVFGLLNRKNGNLLYAVNFYCQTKNPLKPGIHLYNLDSNGNVLWKNSLIDSLNQYNLSSITEIDKNSYLLAGNINNKAYFLICDTLLNIKNQRTFSMDSTKSGTIQKVGLMSNNTIVLLGIDGNIPFIKTIDTAGNLINDIVINTPATYTNNYINFNYNKSSIIINGKIGLNYDSACINYYNMNGQLIKQLLSSHYNRLNKFGLFESYKPNLNMHYSDNNWIKLDSNFNIISKDSIPGYCIGSTGYCNYFSTNTITKISENEIVGVGHKVEGGVNSRTNILQVKKINLENLVANIVITGLPAISTEDGNTLLTANTLPASADNKQIIWSINDTNLATITQTGLLTAKANGTVIVTATAADGGGAKATKAITITNQNVGINEVNLNNLITIYPNPASNVLTINQINANFSYKIMNLQGQEILNGELKKPFSSIDISKLEAGSYIIGLTTDSGIYWKKFVKN